MMSILALIGLIVLVIAAIVLTEVENFGVATVVLIVSVGVAQFYNLVNFAAFARTHALTSVLYTLAYFGVGVGWSFIKWFSFLIGFRDEYRAQKEAFLKKYPIGDSPWTDKIQSDFSSYLGYGTRDYRGHSLTHKPTAAHNKVRIVAWMAFWPCSMIGTLLNDPVRRLFTWLFNNFKALYQHMSDWVFRNEKEMK
jgi:hypothetical protein